MLDGLAPDAQYYVKIKDNRGLDYGCPTGVSAVLLSHSNKIVPTLSPKWSVLNNAIRPDSPQGYAYRSLELTKEAVSYIDSNSPTQISPGSSRPEGI